MSPRKYDLGRRQAAVERNRGAMLSAARDLLIAGGHPGVSVGAVAARAGVSRLTVYNRFGSKARLLRAASPIHAARLAKGRRTAGPSVAFPRSGEVIVMVGLRSDRSQSRSCARR